MKNSVKFFAMIAVLAVTSSIFCFYLWFQSCKYIGSERQGEPVMTSSGEITHIPGVWYLPQVTTNSNLLDFAVFSVIASFGDKMNYDKHGMLKDDFSLVESICWIALNFLVLSGLDKLRISLFKEKKFPKKLRYGLEFFGSLLLILNLFCIICLLIVSHMDIFNYALYYNH